EERISFAKTKTRLTSRKVAGGKHSQTLNTIFEEKIFG
ncbi:MAG: hypothetical protein ACJASQ_004181, partial [Crocinitomicaceae bacterium]